MSTAAADTALQWAVYLRMSRLKSSRRSGPQRGRMRKLDESVERQLAVIRRYAEERGLVIDDSLVFRDNGRSAWQRRGGPPPDRPDWDRMIKAGQAGDFQGVLVWKISRFARNIRDSEDLIDIGLVIAGPDSGWLDLRDHVARSNYRKQVEQATFESDETSSRIRETFRDMTAAGYRVSGSGRTFGFEILSETELDWDACADDGGRFLGPAAVTCEDEAQVIREAAARFLGGDTWAAIAGDLSRRGITTTRGNPWRPGNLARTVGNPINGGWLTVRGEVVRRLANVEPILDADTYQRLQDKMGRQRRGRRPMGKYPLTGELRCGRPECSGHTMAGYPRRNRRTGAQVRAYVCPPAAGGCGQSVLAEPVEAIVRDEVLRRWADARVREQMAEADAQLDEQRARLQRELDDLDADLADTEAKIARVPRSQARRREALDRSLARLAGQHAAKTAEAEALGQPGGGRLADLPAAVTAGEWDDPDITTPADKALMIRRLGLTITILPPLPGSRRTFNPARVQITP